MLGSLVRVLLEPVRRVGDSVVRRARDKAWGWELGAGVRREDM